MKYNESEKDLLYDCGEKLDNLTLNYETSETCQLTNETCKKSKLDKRVKKYSTLKRKEKSKSPSPQSFSLASLSSAAIAKVKDSCLIEEGPFYIHKIAQSEKLDEFRRLYNEDPRRLLLKDNAKNWLPIHYAAFKSKLKILDFIIEKCKPSIINAQDLNGNTPLHIAIERGSKECVTYLLNKNADTTIKNKNSYAPIHQCVISNQPEILDILLTHQKNKINIHLGGENGSTALHTCAYHDNIECAKVLIKHKSNICQTCNNGFFPIHVAAQRCSNKVLELLIGEGNKMGCSKLKMLSFVDGDNNKPLHAAVQFGNLGAVKLCLENGANIDEIIEVDKSTPVHLACSQGSLDILKLMAEKQPDMFSEVIHSNDSLEMTPLHKAAMFDHIDIAGYLLDKGAFIDALDKEKRSPLLLAASRNCVNMACFLISKGSNFRIKDSRLRNLIHLIIDQESFSKNNDSFDNQTVQCKKSSMKALEKILCEISKHKNFTDLFNDQDVNGCTCIHYASKFGHVNCLKLLISYGANINIKNKDKQSPLHFSAKYGRISSCLEILCCDSYKNNINEKDITGMTPLHWAARYGHTKVVELLIQKGALIYKSYGSGNNPFHESALNGFTDCMKIIHNVDPYVLNSINKDGNTALHLACQEGHPNVIQFLLDLGIEFKYNKEGLSFIDLAINYKQQGSLMAIISHDRWEEALNLKSNEYKTPFVGIIQLSSEVTQAVMERCVTKKYLDDSSEKKYSIRYNFKYLNWSDVKVDKDGRFLFSPMEPLVTMVKYGRTDCLSHPLCETLLQRKWSKYGLPLYGLTTLLYLIFLTILTTIIIIIPKCNHEDPINDYVLIDVDLNFTDCDFFPKENIYSYGANSTPLISIYRSIVMMMGETDGLNSFIIPFTNNKLIFGKMSLFFLALFIFLIQILLTNLLIGLAVGDIESVQRDAKLKREAMQVQLHAELEKKMPRKLFERVNEMEYIIVYGDKSNRYNLLKNIFSKIRFGQNSPILKKTDNDSNQIIYLELLRHKEKFKTMKMTLDRQTELLKLILRRMRIKTEESEDRCFDDQEDIDEASSFETQSSKMTNDQIKNNPKFFKYAQEFKKNKFKRSDEIDDSF
ncbi:unnamed protein product [Brachionus calyciflorus]|uniref:Transient receptor potential cation channel subfamily A member 1 n=1 Tax=Brachionus calyciflorus TaxID=104777 RepID=A0A813M9W5_9BILA|nr:unnamed protein product [Brachionus calyciflorus]